MNYLHLSEDKAGVSHFAEHQVALVEQAFAPPAAPMLVSAPEAATRFLLVTLPIGWGGTKHPSPRRQVAFCLAGRLRVEAGDGDVREIGPGGIWRMEDVAGSGHTSTVVGDEPVRLAIVQLD